MTAPHPTWTAILVRWSDSVDELTLDVASGELWALGAEGIEHRDGPPVELVASFGSVEESPEILVGRVQAHLSGLGLPVTDVAVEALPDVDWATHWRRHFRALSFGRVWVVPHWLEAPADAEVVLRIDPGMAFGTGLHPTTALCLERVVEGAPAARVLDVGTGTGILALAAAALGGTAVGTDNDPDAIAVARENAAVNGLADRVELIVDAEVSLEETFELVVANILAEPLIALAGRIGARVAPTGRLLLSGLINTQADAVGAAYRATGLTVRSMTQRGEWVCLELRRGS